MKHLQLQLFARYFISFLVWIMLIPTVWFIVMLLIDNFLPEAVAFYCSVTLVYVVMPFYMQWFIAALQQAGLISIEQRRKYYWISLIGLVICSTAVWGLGVAGR